MMDSDIQTFKMLGISQYEAVGFSVSLTMTSTVELERRQGRLKFVEGVTRTNRSTPYFPLSVELRIKLPDTLLPTSNIRNTLLVVVM